MSRIRELWRQRYGHADDLRETVSLGPVIETMLGHRSVRAFLEEPLAPGTLELLIAAAQSAPTSSNLQAWSVIAVEDGVRKARIAEHAGGQAHIREAPLFLVWLADISRLAGVARRAGMPSEGLAYLDTFLMCAIDAALAAQNALTAAESLGLGAVYIGALRNHPESIREELALEPGVFALFGLCIGKPDPARPAAVKPRLAQRAVLHREQYDSRHAEREVERYDRIMQAFYASQKLDQPAWSKHSSERVRGPERLRGRERLVTALHALGFPLL